MTALWIIIPCLNEAQDLPTVIDSIPRRIDGVDSIEVLLVDDGSTDGSGEIARGLGVRHVHRHPFPRGLAAGFRAGLDYALNHGADIMVVLDGDNQYHAPDTSALVAPIVSGKADVVLGVRPLWHVPHFGKIRSLLQVLGSRVVSVAAGIPIDDATSGFRAFSRTAAFKLTILNHYTHTLETLLQLRTKGLVLAQVPVRVNRVTRPSRLIRRVTSYVLFSIATIVRFFTMYHPLRFYFTAGSLSLLVALGCLCCASCSHATKVSAFVVSIAFFLAGALADHLRLTQRLQEEILERVRRAEYESKGKGA